MHSVYHGSTRAIQTAVRRHRGWPAPTYLRSWSEAEVLEMMRVFALAEEDRHWDDLAAKAERQARLDLGLCL